MTIDDALESMKERTSAIEERMRALYQALGMPLPSHLLNEPYAQQETSVSQFLEGQTWH